MKKYARIFRYLSHYKKDIFLYTLCTILSVAFSIVSIGMLIPFFNLIFRKGNGAAQAAPSSSPMLEALQGAASTDAA